MSDNSCRYTLKIRGVWREEINACGETGAAGDSVGGGAGVRRRARMREKKVACGDGRVGVFVGLGCGEALRGCEFMFGREVAG